MVDFFFFFRHTRPTMTTEGKTMTETKAAITKIQMAYEQVTCSRCAGSGHYSYCQMYGTTCFKCHGRGTVTSKKGSKAAARYQAVREAVLSFRVERVTPGMVLWFDSEPALPGCRGLKAGWFRVTEVAPAPDYQTGHRGADGETVWVNHQRVMVSTAGRTVYVPVDGMVLRQPTRAALEMMAAQMQGIDGVTVTVERGAA